MSDATWLAISAISAAVAAIAALITVGISIFRDNKHKSQVKLNNNMALYAALVLVDRSLDFVIREPNQKGIDKVEKSLIGILQVVATTNGVIEVSATLPTDVEKCLSWIDEQKINEFKAATVKNQFSKYELKFRSVKNILEDKLDIKHS